jgi:molecular chaperone HtpG
MRKEDDMADDKQLPTQAEKEAKRAESLPAFHGLNLLHIRRQVTRLLKLIGGDGIFDQFTAHDITHIDKMLDNLEWIIPDTTKNIMSPADWLMTVLSIYFHDMGMLVTAREFDNREQSGFPRYKSEILFGGSSGIDYKEKVQKLPADRVERFLYQEFVRSIHAERIRMWVTGKASDGLGITKDVSTAIDKLLEPLGEQFRRDLGLICESHHLNDLNELKKYKVAEPYGDSDAETANLQYCAVLLRTADLMHITSDRVPSITFKVINPTDPLSQQEWAKQEAVTRVHPKMGLNDEGLPDEKAIKDTIQVHAFFKSEDGFFGLTSYLSYCATQLKLSHDWISNTAKLKLAKHEFPWRRIDDSNIETVGFLKDTFEFAIDQPKILDLLTGHTLYNDTRVVIRELVQNALDAIRIQHFPYSPLGKGKVDIVWDSKARQLTVTDNGTGMSQRFISNFLLKVGTSRYQDPEFKKQFPGFSSISRFGIGVLSTFMIADSVEITTCHQDDEEARQLTLRSVHGKYLIRTLDKSNANIKNIYPHGASFTLKVRPSVKMTDVLLAARMWIVVPRCDVFVTIDDKSPVKVGNQSLTECISSVLSDAGFATVSGTDTSAPLDDKIKRPVRVIEKEVDGVMVAYAVQWSEYFREWSFLSAQQLRGDPMRPIMLGTCIEGIRVEFQTPGFAAPSIVAIANVIGPNAPKTNVARSGIEATEERDFMLKQIYSIYRNHIAQEIKQLQEARSYSLTWAIEEARYLVATLLTHPTSEELLEDELTQLPALAVERDAKRFAISPKELAKEKQFWTIECTLLQPAEALVREAATQASLSGLVRAMNLPNFEFPDDLVLCGLRPSSPFGKYAYNNREVDKIVVNRTQRRVDLRWAERASKPRWLSLGTESLDVIARALPPHRGRDVGQLTSIYVGSHGIEVSDDVEPALRTLDSLFLMPATPAAKFLVPMLERLNSPHSILDVLGIAFNLFMINEFIDDGGEKLNPERLVTQILNEWENSVAHTYDFANSANPTALIQFLNENKLSAFAPSAWSRKWSSE